MALKIYYDCGCIGYVSNQRIFVRVTSCAEHQSLAGIVKPQSDVTNQVAMA
jgi:hypothetical protein